MKKPLVTSFLFCFLSVCAAFAQGSDLNGRCFTIHNAISTGAYMQDNLTDGDVVDAFGMNEYSYWKFISTGNEDCYYILNVSTNRYIQGHGDATQVRITAGKDPAEYYVKSSSTESGAYGFSSTNASVHDFSAGCVGLNLQGEPYESVSCVQTYAAVEGTNHRSFWVLDEVDESQISIPHIVEPEDLSGVSEDELYRNPVVSVSLPDPTVIKADDGYFYLYATENIRNIPIYRSENLVDWEFVGTCFTEETRPTFVETDRASCLWAPDINKIGDKYVMYYAMSDWGGEWTCGIGVATADKPEGPFTDLGPLFISSEMGTQNSIDPFYIEEDDGSKYLFWGSFSGIWYTQLTDDGLSLKDGLAYTQVAGTMTEGTYIIKRPDGYYYMIGSAGTCCDGLNSTYRLLVARSKSLFGPYVNRVGLSVMDNNWSILLEKSEAVYGPGHCSEIVEDYEGSTWIFYHGWDAATGEGRYLYLDRVYWDEDGWPCMTNMQPTAVSRRPKFNAEETKVSLPDADGELVVSPKQTRDSIDISLAGKERFSWQIMSTHGETVAQGKAQGETAVDVSSIPWGLYLVNVKTKNKSYTEKILKQ